MDKLTIEQAKKFAKELREHQPIQGLFAQCIEQLAETMRENEVLLAGWGAIQDTLKNYATQGYIRGWQIKPIPEAVAAQELWKQRNKDSAE